MYQITQNDICDKFTFNDTIDYNIEWKSYLRKIPNILLVVEIYKKIDLFKIK